MILYDFIHSVTSATYLYACGAIKLVVLQSLTEFVCHWFVYGLNPRTVRYHRVTQRIATRYGLFDTMLLKTFIFITVKLLLITTMGRKVVFVFYYFRLFTV